MLNQAILVGRLVGEPTTIVEEDNGKDFTIITLACNRSFKNALGVYETDFIKVRLFGQVATNTIEYCKNGDLIGVKGRIESEGDRIIIIGDKITFLASRGSNNEL